MAQSTVELNQLGDIVTANHFNSINNVISKEREIYQLRDKIDTFARDIMNCLAGNVRRNVLFDIIIKQLIRICFQYGSQVSYGNCKGIKRRC